VEVLNQESAARRAGVDDAKQGLGFLDAAKKCCKDRPQAGCAICQLWGFSDG
jgi:hypothetical protein